MNLVGITVGTSVGSKLYHSSCSSFDSNSSSHQRKSKLGVNELVWQAFQLGHMDLWNLVMHKLPSHHVEFVCGVHGIVDSAILSCSLLTLVNLLKLLLTMPWTYWINSHHYNI